MSKLFMCNTSTDSLSIVNIDKFIEEKKLYLREGYSRRIGPHGICRYEDKIITANSYSNTISIIDTESIKIQENYYIGEHCNDINIIKNIAYVICGDLNNVVIFDLNKKIILEEIPCGNSPHSIDINKRDEKIIIANMQSDSITFIDCIRNYDSKEIKVGAYPTKAIFSSDGSYILVCESNIGMDSKGSISIISLNNFKILNRVPVGNSPVDIFSDENYCYVSNFGEGTISIIELSKFKEINRIEIGGMPRGIIKKDDNIFVGDNYNNVLIKLDLIDNSKKIIPIGGEPTGLILVN